MLVHKSFHLRMNIGDIEKMLNGIEEGVSYLPPRLAAILREHNLPCLYRRTIPEGTGRQ
jgi:hypothetical protein